MDDFSGPIMPEKVVLYAIRHGETANNKEKKFRGWSEVPLDDNGRAQAETLRKKFLDKKVGQIYCSRLDRTIDTCAIVFGEAPYTSVAYLDSLKPLNVGDLAGEPKDMWRGFIERAATDWNVRYPSGESINQFIARLKTPIFQMIKAGLDGEPSVAVWHSSNMHTLGQLVNGDNYSALVAPGGYVEVTFDGEKFYAKPAFKAKDEQFN